MNRGPVLVVAGLAAVAMAATLLAASAPARDAASGGPSPAALRGALDGSVADPVHGEAVFRACSACHTIGRGGADVDGPNLYGVVASRIAGRRPRYGYTQALRDVGGTWTEERLQAWLTDPAVFAPGTAMRFPGLPDARDRADVIAYLTTQGPPRR